jgi:translocator protein
MSLNDGVALAISVGVCFAAAGIGTLSTLNGLRAWYPSLRKPTWNPPNALFGPVWTVLYLSMAVAVWLVWRAAVNPVPALALFAAQLALNVTWSVTFFGQRKVGGALVVIGVLWLMIAATIGAFWSVDPLAGLMLVPYLAWVTFASLLNAAIARLNSGS